MFARVLDDAGVDVLLVGGAPGRCERHHPEQTLLYQVIAQHYPAFLARLTAEGRTLPRYVQHESDAYLKCGLLEHGFMRVRCKECHREKFGDRAGESVAKAAGFSLHAGVATQAHQKNNWSAWHAIIR